MPKLTWICVLLTLCVFSFTACFGARDDSSSSMAPSSSSSGMMSDAMSDASGAMSDAKSGMSGAMSDAKSAASGAMSDVRSNASSMMDNATSSMSSAMSDASKAAAAEAESEWALRLVSAESPLPEGFSVETRAIPGYENREFDVRAADALEAMLRDAEAAGCKLYLVSAYRSMERQDALFRRKTAAFMEEGFPQEEAEKQAARYVARPGTSEHNLGLAADIVSANWYASNTDLTTAFADTPHYEWLREHCAEYGFIERYPEGKEGVTGVTYEPWHFRYVGKEAAEAIMSGGSTLEEYLAA